MIKNPLQFAKSDKGFNVFYKKVDHIPAVKCTAHFNVGSIQDYPNKDGISHLLEHMIFETSNNGKKNRIIEKLDQISNTEATTGNLSTNYSFYASHRNFKKCFEYLCDILFYSDFNEDLLEIEKSVVLEEARGYYNSLDAFALCAMNDIIHPNGTMHSILGDKASIKRITLNDLYEFRNQYYNKHNLYFICTGEIELDYLLYLIDEKVPSLNNGDYSRTQTSLNLDSESHTIDASDFYEASDIYLCSHIDDNRLLTENYSQFSLLMSYLKNTIYNNLRRSGICYYASTDYYLLRNAILLDIKMCTHKIKQAKDVVFKILEDINSNLYNTDYMENSKSKLALDAHKFDFDVDEIHLQTDEFLNFGLHPDQILNIINNEKEKLKSENIELSSDFAGEVVQYLLDPTEFLVVSDETADD